MRAPGRSPNSAELPPVRREVEVPAVARADRLHPCHDNRGAFVPSVLQEET
jgi:hypothetical protein